MNKFIVTQTSWALPVLYQLCRDLRELGEKVSPRPRPTHAARRTSRHLLTLRPSLSYRPTTICSRSERRKIRSRSRTRQGTSTRRSPSARPTGESTRACAKREGAELMTGLSTGIHQDVQGCGIKTMGDLLRRWNDHQVLLQGRSRDFPLPVRTPSPSLDPRVLAPSGRLLTLCSHRWTFIPGQSSDAVQEHHPRDRLVVEPSAVRLLSDRPPSDLAVLHGHAQLPRGRLSEGGQRLSFQTGKTSLGHRLCSVLKAPS